MVGGWHAQRHQAYRAGVGPANAPKLGKHWLADLNLNPRYRGAAGYGAEVVRKNQEDYVDACWDQIGDILAAEMKFNLTRLAIEALGALKRKHFDVLPPERLLQVFGPALPRIEAFGTAAQTFRINGEIASLGGRLDRSSMPVALVDAALRRVASPGESRFARGGTAQRQSTAALPSLARNYVLTMARATTKPVAFAVNAFMPDGIVGTKLFEGVDLAGAADVVIDLGEIGLRGAQFTVGQVRQALASGKVAAKTLASKGVPDLRIRAGQHLGVFTDLHVDRFGLLASHAPTMKASDWRIVASQVEGARRARCRGLPRRVDQPNGAVAGQRDAARRAQWPLHRWITSSAASTRCEPLLPLEGDSGEARAAAALAGTRIGQVTVATSREFNPGGLISRPAAKCADDGGRRAGADASRSTRTSSSSPSENPDGSPPPIVSVTFPPAIRNREVLNRFSTATQGVQATWGDAFAAQARRGAGHRLPARAGGRSSCARAPIRR